MHNLPRYSIDRDDINAHSRSLSISPCDDSLPFLSLTIVYCREFCNIAV
jgi:hypothetical protein